MEGIYGMPEWYVRCLDVSEGQVRTSQVRISKVRSGQLRIGVWQVSGGCHIFWTQNLFDPKFFATPNFSCNKNLLDSTFFKSESSSRTHPRDIKIEWKFFGIFKGNMIFCKIMLLNIF